MERTKPTKPAAKIRKKSELTEALKQISEVVAMEQRRFFLAMLKKEDTKEIEARGQTAIGMQKMIQWVLGADNEFGKMLKDFERIDQGLAPHTLEEKDELQDWEFRTTPPTELDGDAAFTKARVNEPFEL